jgi:hypothetical protein
MNERIVLSHDLFEGDFGELDTITLENKMVKTNKDHEKPCHICEGKILKGERSRMQKDIFEGQIETYRVCEKCCEAISYDYENYDPETYCDDKVDERYKIGHGRRHT